MDPSLQGFIRQFVGAVAATLMPVVLVAFWAMPYCLGSHPGERPAAEAQMVRHMT
jgi:hypothetical protein